MQSGWGRKILFKFLTPVTIICCWGVSQGRETTTFLCLLHWAPLYPSRLLHTTSHLLWVRLTCQNYCITNCIFHVFNLKLRHLQRHATVPCSSSNYYSNSTTQFMILATTFIGQIFNVPAFNKSPPSMKYVTLWFYYSDVCNCKVYRHLIINRKNSPSGHIFQCISANCCDTNTGQDRVQSQNGHTL